VDLRAVSGSGRGAEFSGAARTLYRGGSRIRRKTLILEVGPPGNRSFSVHQGAYYCLGPVHWSRLSVYPESSRRRPYMARFGEFVRPTPFYPS